MKILVTGANGYLGQGIVRIILNNGHCVVATDFNTQFVDERAERNIDFLSSGERKGKSLNRYCYGNAGVVGLQYSSNNELERSGKFVHRG